MSKIELCFSVKIVVWLVQISVGNYCPAHCPWGAHDCPHAPVSPRIKVREAYDDAYSQKDKAQLKLCLFLSQCFEGVLVGIVDSIGYLDSIFLESHVGLIR